MWSMIGEEEEEEATPHVRKKQREYDEGNHYNEASYVREPTRKKNRRTFYTDQNNNKNTIITLHIVSQST